MKRRQMMRPEIIAMACLIAFFAAAQVNAGGETEKEEAAKSKAAVEEKAAAEGIKARPTDAITKGEAQAIDPKGKERLDAITCLAGTIYWEARNEGFAVMEAVAGVVMNRLCHEGFPGKICGIVKQRQEQHACQFFFKNWHCPLIAGCAIVKARMDTASNTDSASRGLLGSLSGIAKAKLG